MHCVDTIGTYACICDPGWTWNPEKSNPDSANPNGRVPTPENNYWVYDVDSTADPQIGNGNYDPSQGDECIDYDECQVG